MYEKLSENKHAP